MHFHKPSYLTSGIIKSTVSLLPIAIFVLIIYAFDTPFLATATLLCAGLHEVGHLILIKILGYGADLKGVLSGLKIYVGGTVCYRHTMLIALGGPLMNLTLALISLPLSAVFRDFATCFCLVNLISAICNLLPLVNNDGYNILLSLLRLKLDEYDSQRIMIGISSILSSLICIFSLWAMSRLDAAYWCYFISMYLLVKSTSSHR